MPARHSRTGPRRPELRTAFIAALLLGGGALSLAAPAAPASWPFGLGPVEHTGPALYQARCGGCHALDHNRYGPMHRGVFGRAAGTQPGYRYTDALKRSGIIWTAENLDAWMEDPRRMVPGTRMDARLKDPEERRIILEYLRREGAQEAPASR